MSHPITDPPIPRLPYLIATWFGFGNLPKAPGTWGSLGALPFAWGIATLGGGRLLLVATLCLFVIGLWATKVYIKHTGEEDPAAVVVDEVVGQWVTLLLMEPNLLIYGLAFILFRLFDIFKPWPVRWVDRRVKGEWGVMLDDVIAGLYATIALIGLALFMGRMIG